MINTSMSYLNLTECSHIDPSFNECLVEPSKELYEILLDDKFQREKPHEVALIFKKYIDDNQIKGVITDKYPILAASLLELNVEVFDVTYEKFIDDIFRYKT